MIDEFHRKHSGLAFRKHNVPTTEEVKALDGRTVASLTERERQVLEFYWQFGRPFGVSIMISDDVDPSELAAAQSPAEADALLDPANQHLSVTLLDA